jgi:hypothetical protein
MGGVPRVQLVGLRADKEGQFPGEDVHPLLSVVLPPIIAVPVR